MAAYQNIISGDKFIIVVQKCPEISRFQDTRKPEVIIPTLAVALEFLLKNALFDRFLFTKSYLSG